MNDWLPTKDRFVLYLDILGFKELLFRSDHNTVLQYMEFMRERFDEIEKHDETAIKALFFSDSIILISKNDSLESAEIILLAAAWLSSSSIIKGIPIKGALGYGTQTADFERSILFGRPLIDAYLLQDELLLCGVILHNSAEKKLTGLKLLNNVNNIDNPFANICWYKTPMKAGKINHYILYWPEWQEQWSTVNKAFSLLYGKIAGNARIYIDNTVEFKDYFIQLVKNNKASKAKQKKV
jgi:hypothetical protein